MELGWRLHRWRRIRNRSARHRECGALFGELVSREYSNRDDFSVHQLTVVTCSAQYPGEPKRRTIQ
jgi:hypothetical protein